MRLVLYSPESCCSSTEESGLLDIFSLQASFWHTNWSISWEFGHNTSRPQPQRLPESKCHRSVPLSNCGRKWPAWWLSPCHYLYRWHNGYQYFSILPEPINVYSNAFPVNLTPWDLGASRFGPIPLFAIRLKPGDNILLPLDSRMSGNDVYQMTGQEPEFVRTLKNNLHARRYPQFDEVSICLSWWLTN